MLLVALFLWPFLRDSHIARPEAVILLAVFAILIFLTVYAARRESKLPGRQSESLEPDAKHDTRSAQKNVLFVLIGLAG